MALHNATNPEALAAAINALESARYALGPLPQSSSNWS
jgi:hypothetical protein